MTGTICSIATCKSKHGKDKKDGEIVRFFTFPKNLALRKQWVRLCCRKDNFNPVNKRICSKHFDSNQFEDIMHAKLTNTLPRKLKETGKSLNNLNYNKAIVKVYFNFSCTDSIFAKQN